MTDSPLDDTQFMDALLDVLIPPNGDVPGAGALGLGPEVATGLLADRMLGPLVGPGLGALRDAFNAAAPEARTQLIAGALTANSMLPMGLLRYLYPAYYAQPQVLAAIGEPPRPPFPLGFEVEETDPALQAKLKDRARFQ